MLVRGWDLVYNTVAELQTDQGWGRQVWLRHGFCLIVCAMTHHITPVSLEIVQKKGALYGKMTCRVTWRCGMPLKC